MWITRDGTQNAVHSVFIILEHWYTPLHVRAFLAWRKEGPINNLSVKRGTFFHSLSTSSRKEDLMDIDMVKSRETRNTLRLTNWRKDARKYFHGIHDRFIRDPEFRSRMIENHRDEELCWRWDALADEDHTHNLTTQGYSLYQSKWWLHSKKKKGSNTIRLTQRPDFKQALSTLHRLQREAEGDTQVPTYSNRSQQWAQSSSSTWWNWQGSWWTPYPSERHDGDAPSIEWTGRPVDCSIWKDSSGQDFLEFNLLCYRWIVYSWRRSIVTDGRCKHNTLNDPFSRCQRVQ